MNEIKEPILNLTSTPVNKMPRKFKNLVECNYKTSMEKNRNGKLIGAKGMAYLATGYNYALLGRYRTAFTMWIEQNLPDGCEGIYGDY